MKKLMMCLVVLAMLSVCALSYGTINTGHYVLVYKGTITASRTIFDANDDSNDLLAGSIKCFLAVDINGAADANKGKVDDSNAVIYSQKNPKAYTVIPDAIEINPHDPCFVELLGFEAPDSDGGNLSIEVVGKGKLTKIYDVNRLDTNTLVKKFVPLNMKGAGSSDAFSFLDPNQAISGTVAVTMTLDPILTKKANSDGNSVNGVTNSFISKLNKNHDFTKVSE